MQYNKSLYYEIVMSLLAVATVVITLMDLAGNIPEDSYLLNIDTAILLIFAADYFLRLYLSKHKMDYVKKYIFDLIAIIPFSAFFRLFRIGHLIKIIRITKFTRVTRFFRLAVFLRKFNTISRSFVKTNGLVYVIYLTFTSVILGAVAIFFAENGKTVHSFADALWWSFVTTTVGFGEISPATGIGKIIAAVLMLTGIGFIGMFTGTVATFFLSPKSKAVDEHSRVLDLSDLSDEDFDAILNIVKGLRD